MQEWGAGDYYRPAVDGQWGEFGPWTPCCPGKLPIAAIKRSITYGIPKHSQTF